MTQFKINQEDFERKAQHILDTVVKPQVEKYEQAKAKKESIVDEETFESILKKTMIPSEYLGKQEQ